MARKGYVDALWVGLPSEFGDRTQLAPGETVVEIGEHEARASDNWQVVGEEKPLNQRPVKELRAIAAERGVEIPEGAKGGRILALLTAEPETAPEAEPDPDPDPDPQVGADNDAAEDGE